MATNNNPNNLKPGDRVAFDIKDNAMKPYGYGIVTRATEATGVMFTPEVPFSTTNPKVENIRKVG